MVGGRRVEGSRNGSGKRGWGENGEGRTREEDKG